MPQCNRFAILGFKEHIEDTQILVLAENPSWRRPESKLLRRARAGRKCERLGIIMKFHDPLLYSNSVLLLSGTRRYPREQHIPPQHAYTLTHACSMGLWRESCYASGWGGRKRYHCIKSIGLITPGMLRAYVFTDLADPAGRGRRHSWLTNIAAIPATASFIPRQGRTTPVHCDELGTRL